jgi:subfamily B ATP-binding cassette protein MsbA
MRQDIANVRSMAFGYLVIVQDIMGIVSLSVLVFTLDPVLTFCSFIALPVLCAPLVLYSRKRLRAASGALRQTNYALFETVLQLLSGIRVIKVYQAEENETRVAIAKSQKYFDVFFSTTLIRSRVQLMIESIGGLSLMTIITLGGYRVSHGLMSWEKMVAFVFAARSLFTPLYDLYGTSSENNTNRASAARISELLGTKTEIRDRPDAIPLLHAPKLIGFENVGFGYQGPQVLKNINFEIREGETIGIVGPSGAGKSTLLNLIVRFYDPTEGKVLFDGVDLRRYKLVDIYNHMAIVTQDPFLFATSVRENIRCAKPQATDLEVEEAARAAYVHNDIMGLPNGYETVVGLAGRELSRGQAQRINVARALLRDAKLLVLDEPTSSLDSVAEAEVQQSIDRLMQGRTCFMVAHRLSTLRNADRLIVLEHGRCVAIGRHAELIESCELYRRLWQLQVLDDMEKSGDDISEHASVTAV